MLFKKITTGFVNQTFNDAGECIDQDFTAGDQVDYETEDGDPINVMDMPLGGDEYQPLEMVQPGDQRLNKDLSLVIITSPENGVQEIIPCDSDKAMDVFLGQCSAEVSNWDEHSVEDIEAIKDNGYYETVGGKYICIWTF